MDSTHSQDHGESAHSTAHNSSFHSIPLYLPHLSMLHLCWSHFQSPVLVTPVCQVTGDSGSFPGQGEQGSWGATLRRHTQDPEPEHPLVPPHSCPGGSVSFLLPHALFLSHTEIKSPTRKLPTISVVTFLSPRDHKGQNITKER